MRKLYLFGAIALACVVIGLAWAQDEFTLTTYYPAPYGVYNQMRVMRNLGVGTMDPQERWRWLEVALQGCGSMQVMTPLLF